MAAIEQLDAAAGERRGDSSGLSRREALWGILFIAPWIVGFLLFTLIPMGASLVLSFTDFHILRPGEINWIGTANYTRMLNDSKLWHSLRITAWFAVLSVPAGLALTVGIAVLVNAERLLFKRLFRTLFYMPSIIPVVAVTLIWGGVLNGQTGWINRSLAVIGIQGPNWVLDTTWVYPSLVFMGFWGIGGGMLITLAALQNVPSELYDAAKVDGAGPVRSFFNITLPMITPVIFYLLVVSLIGVSQYFTQPFVLSNGTGRPGDATMFFNINLYKEAFTFQQMGYASAQGWLMFVIVLLLTVFLFGTARYWVYYAGAEE
jgi:multiple sugar transport system permease protein